MFERKGSWYRFSDEEVAKGGCATFQDAGYLANPDSWYLSNPKDPPEDMFAGITVVLVSPKAIKVNKFLKQVKSKRVFMPVLSLDELLDFQRVVFPGVPSADVERAFDHIGGVAEQSLILTSSKL